MSDDRPTVLVVDDEPNVAEAYALWLSEEYDVRTASNGETALRTVDEDTDVVLLDRRMPRMSGDEALDRIRSAGYDCRVAMVTAVDPDFDIVEMPFDDYLTKPVSRDEVFETVENLLELSAYDDVIREQFGLAKTLSTLEGQKSQERLAENEEYAEAAERFEELAEESEETVEQMDHETFKSAISTIDSELRSRG